MKDKQARELIRYQAKVIDMVFKKSLNNLTQIESLTDKIKSMDKTLDSFGFRSCPKCERRTMTIKYHYMRSFDMKEDGTIYKIPEYECLICGTRYDLKEQPVIKEDENGRD